MERLVNNIANSISKELKLNNDNREVIAYGMFSLFQAILSIGLVFLFALLFNVVIEALIISFTAAILRKYSGGVHASSIPICNLIGIIVCVVPAVFISFLIGAFGTLNLVIILGFTAFILSYYLIYKLSPVGNMKKTIKSKEKRKRMKKGSLIVLSIYLAVVVLLITLFAINGEKRSLVYATCVYFGALWQVFTITYQGKLTILKIDTLLNNILFSIRR
ncbi:accessory gene regulator ArgB-like protein [Clostridium akagii]|uniref:accessory gene regulator ArgB-like protein n=1 Tax=Clostridium akagii TaxID=91623 RepID=UPI000A054A2E|nr:accessory gene regulator B family protein [Clostridium akagii]